MKSNYDLAKEVLAGLWGNGVERRERLTNSGYDYTAVQTIVNALVIDGGYIPNEPERQPETKRQGMNTPLEVDYDPSTNDGIVINIIVKR